MARQNVDSYVFIFIIYQNLVLEKIHSFRREGIRRAIVVSKLCALSRKEDRRVHWHHLPWFWERHTAELFSLILTEEACSLIFNCKGYNLREDSM
jgi:hypothetical protein